jgi:hypothetical protein
MLKIKVPNTNSTYISHFANPYATILLKEMEHYPLECRSTGDCDDKKIDKAL